MVPFHKQEKKQNVKKNQPVSFLSNFRKYIEKYLKVLYTMKCTHFLWKKN